MTSSKQLAPVVFLMGPTASGKTALAIELYQTGKFEIISVDSAMVYQEMNIGSAKPSEKELLLAPHHLIDFIDPKEAYSAAQFAEDAKVLIKAIHRRGKIPLLAGGTMLYFKALQQGLADLPEIDPLIREKIRSELAEQGSEFMHGKLLQVDPPTAERLHPSDSQRISRALEVYHSSGKPLSQWHAEQALQALPNPLLSIALAPSERAVLHKRIADRFEQMLADGLLDEVSKLFNRGDLSLDCPSMRSVGYRQIWQYLDGELSLLEAKERAIIATRQLAKRQYTWMRSWPDLIWYDSLDANQLQQAKQKILSFVDGLSLTKL